MNEMQPQHTAETHKYNTECKKPDTQKNVHYMSLFM